MLVPHGRPKGCFGGGFRLVHAVRGDALCHFDRVPALGALANIDRELVALPAWLGASRKQRAQRVALVLKRHFTDAVVAHAGTARKQSMRRMTRLVLSEKRSQCEPRQITNLARCPQPESGRPHPRFDAPPESLAGTMHFHTRGFHAHPPPHLLGSISRGSTPFRAHSTRSTVKPRRMDIENGSSVCELL